MAVAGHGSPTAKGGIWKACTEAAFCYQVHAQRLSWFFNSGAKSNMQPEYYTYADRNWPAIRNMSEGKPFAPYCFNTNFIAY